MKITHKNIDFIIPPVFFEVKPPVILTEIPYCDKNEVASKQFIKKFNKFTNDKNEIWIKWLTRKMKTLFKLKDLVKVIEEFVFVEKHTSQELFAKQKQDGKNTIHHQVNQTHWNTSISI